MRTGDEHSGRSRRITGSVPIPVLALVLLGGCGGDSPAAPADPPPASGSGAAGSERPYPQSALLEDGSRNKFRWPFASTSIWNMPIGSGAAYVPAHIPAPQQMGMTVDEDVIVLRPQAPLKPVQLNDAGWSRDRTRCGSVQAGLVYPDPVPVPDDFWTDPGYLGLTPNQGAAILMPDSSTVRQTQPFHVCAPGGTVTSGYASPDQDIATGDGAQGAHGGSGLSALGGTVRVGELVPGGGIRHALKLNLFAHRNLWFDPGEPTPGYRWPAVKADGYADEAGHPCAYEGPLPALEMGALLALLPDADVEGLRTEPARILARTLRDYGGYVVDDTCWDVYAVAVEWGPDGRVIDEFLSAWGFPMESSLLPGCSDDGLECQWVRDMANVFDQLHVVSNNSAQTVGGGGAPRQPLAPPVGN